MPSLLPDYEYDIFVSYRHNDNLGGWVTNFVESLEKELRGTLKDSLTIYFDKNPHDGLLETHHVDKSLEGKLKCLIFIPIISQTYCDPKSFAWQHEFCAFNNLAQGDQLGRDIKLSNGNVTSRILPIKIHELDADDSATVEAEIGGVLRAIEFIYKEPGVNRPLSVNDNRKDNLNKTDYKNQVNKVANAIKEILGGINKSPGLTNDPQKRRINELHAIGVNHARNRKLTWVAGFAIVLIALLGYYFYSKNGSDAAADLDKSIAVLPFLDMSPGKDQEYLSDGLAEDIITALSKIKGLKVIGRTSSFQFKGDKLDLREIGERLKVSTILEGSVMKSGEKIRITTQLINVKDGAHIWSEKFDRDLSDIFSIQDEISQAITSKMKITLMGNPEKVNPTTNMEAYENVLRGTAIYKNYPWKAKEAIPFFERAIAMDSNYLDAYNALGDAYLFGGLYGVIPSKNVNEQIRQLTNKMLSLDSTSSHTHSLLFALNFYFNWDWAKAEAEYNKTNKVPSFHHVVYMLMIQRNYIGALEEGLKLVEMDPLINENLRILSYCYYFNGQHQQAYDVVNKLLSYDSTNTAAIYHLGQLQLYDSEFELAYQTLDHGSYFTAIVLCNMGKKKEALALLESSNFSPTEEAVIYSYLGNLDKSFQLLEEAFMTNDINLLWLLTGPVENKEIRKDPRFDAFIKKMNFPQN